MRYIWTQRNFFHIFRLHSIRVRHWWEHCICMGEYAVLKSVHSCLGNMMITNNSYRLSLNWCDWPFPAEYIHKVILIMSQKLSSKFLMHEIKSGGCRLLKRLLYSDTSLLN